MVGRIVFNTTAQVVGKMISTATAVVVAFFLAGRLGAEGFGEFIKITAFVAPFFLLSDFGLNAVWLQRGKDGIPWSDLLGVRLVGSIGLTFFMLAIVAFIPQGTHQGYTPLVRFGIILFSLSIVFQAIITTVNALFQKHLRYELATVALAAGSAVTILLVASVPPGVLSAIIAVLVGTAVSGMVSLVIARQFAPFTFSLSRQCMTRLLIPSVPLGVTLLFNLVYVRADTYIITLTRSTGEVGIYGLAYKVFEVVLVLPTFFMNAVYPLMIKEISDKKEVINKRLLRLFKRSLFFLLLISFLLSIITIATAPLVSLIKSDFTASVAPLRVLSLGLPFFFLTSLTMWTLIALKKQWLLATIYGGSMVVNIIANIVLVPTYGYMAAAWMTVVSEGLVLTMTSFVLLRAIKGVALVE